MRDLLSTLPAPLPLMIVEGIEDLASLYHVIQAWPTAAVIFERDYCRIIRSILSSYTWDLQQLLYFRLYLQTEGSTATEGLTNFLRGRDYMNTNLPSGPGDLQASFSFSAARSLLFVAHHIQEAAHAFLQTHRCRTTSPKSSRFSDLKYYDRSSHRKRSLKSRTFQSRNAGLASWDEHQHVMLSLWRL